MIDEDARTIAAASTVAELVERLRARTSTTNRPPAPVATMLSEVVVHSEDIRRPLGLAGTTPSQAVAACLDLNVRANFPVGTKKRVAGLHLVASDMKWSSGSGRTVRGPAMSLLMAITGRRAALSDLDGDGLADLAERSRPTG